MSVRTPVATSPGAAVPPLESAHLGAGVGFDPAAGGAGTLPRSWARHFEARPEALALADDAGRTWCYRDLDAASRRAAARLDAAGLRPGDRVLTSAGASLEGVASHVACLRLGLVVVPVHAAYSRAELDPMLKDAAPRAALVDDPERADWLRELDPALWIASPERLGAPADVEGEAPSLDGVAPEAPALLVYTSGTTGRPKGALLSHANLLASVESVRLAWRWTPADRLLLALPLFHMHGLGVGLHGTLHAGAAALLLPRFDPVRVVAEIDRFGATLFFGVPTMYHRLVATPGHGSLRALRLCVSGSAPLPAELHEAFERVTGQRILERYGMTETVMLVSNPVEGERRPGSVGLPLPGVELRLAPSDTRSAALSAPGEIQVRGPNVFAGYWERPEANATAFTADGWFRTGDLGELDSAGYLRIVGRAKELIISGGYNVYPREVEDALRAHPGIEDVAVVGQPSSEWGELVSAYVVGPDPPPLEALRGFLAERLAPYKHPRALHRVEALPRNALGKVQKQRLRDGIVGPEASDDPSSRGPARDV